MPFPSKKQQNARTHNWILLQVKGALSGIGAIHRSHTANSAAREYASLAEEYLHKALIELKKERIDG